MSLIDEREAATPGWRWLQYRTWRCFNVDYESPSVPSGHRYHVTKVVPVRIDRRQLRLA